MTQKEGKRFFIETTLSACGFVPPDNVINKRGLQYKSLQSSASLIITSNSEYILPPTIIGNSNDFFGKIIEDQENRWRCDFSVNYSSEPSLFS